MPGTNSPEYLGHAHDLAVLKTIEVRADCLLAQAEVIRAKGRFVLFSGMAVALVIVSITADGEWSALTAALAAVGGFLRRAGVRGV
jgi:hypothetical protein